MSARFPKPEGHLHECKHREDDICSRSGRCECACGATRPFPTLLDQKRNVWTHDGVPEGARR